MHRELRWRAPRLLFLLIERVVTRELRLVFTKKVLCMCTPESRSVRLTLGGSSSVCCLFVVGRFWCYLRRPVGLGAGVSRTSHVSWGVSSFRVSVRVSSSAALPMVFQHSESGPTVVRRDVWRSLR